MSSRGGRAIGLIPVVRPREPHGDRSSVLRDLLWALIVMGLGAIPAILNALEGVPTW